MIIKPWTDLPPPRHLLKEDVEDEDASVDNTVIPNIEIKLHQSEKYQTFIVVPSSLSKIISNMGNTTKVGQINVSYPTITSSGESNIDYDEEIQLYGNELTNVKKDFHLDINQIDEATVFISIPHITDYIITNLIASQLINRISYKKLLTISIDNNLEEPSYLSNTTNLQVNLPFLTPPNYSTGSISSFVSRSVMLHRDTISLITNDSLNSLLDICHALKSLLKLKDVNYISKCRKNLSYSSNINGLYV